MSIILLAVSKKQGRWRTTRSGETEAQAITYSWVDGWVGVLSWSRSKALREFSQSS